MTTQDDTKDKLKWKFSDGPLLTQADFGDPTSAASYALCIYDDGALKVDMQVSPSGPWIKEGTKGYRYGDAAGTNDDNTKAKLLVGQTANRSCRSREREPICRCPRQ